MNPDEMLRVPFHPAMHPDDQRTIGLEIREPFWLAPPYWYQPLS